MSCSHFKSWKDHGFQADLIWWWLNLPDYPECSQLRCANGACYNRTQQCDQILDCRDGSDEANCSKMPVKNIHFQPWPSRALCRNRAKARHHYQVTIFQYCCSIFFVSSLAQHCNAGLFQCHSGVCVPQRYVCDHDDDCGDRSDELNCSMYWLSPLSLVLSCYYILLSILTILRVIDEQLILCMCIWISSTAYPPCRGNHFTCPSGRCIHQVWVCDGEDDCEDNADEKGCGMDTIVGISLVHFYC